MSFRIQLEWLAACGTCLAIVSRKAAFVPIRITRAVAALIGVVGFAAPALAQNIAAPGIDALKACRGIAPDAERLVCLDRASVEIIGAADRGEIRLLTKKDVEQTRRGLFGFNLPKLALFGGSKGEDDQAEMLESTITSARQIDRSTYVFKIADGDATWQIKDAPGRFIPPKSGDKVVFKRASLGSYFIRINDRIGVKGRRTN